MVDFGLLQDALGSVYDTALSSSAWPAALSQLCRLFNCHFADTFERTQDFGHWRGTQVGLDEGDYQDVFLGYWVKNNVWSKRRPTRRSGDIVTTRDIISKRELTHTDMYSEYLRRRGFEEGLRLDVWADASGVEDISLLRPWSANPYSVDELQAARLLMPHLQRASAVRRRLAAAASLAGAGLATLEYLQMGVLLLRRNGGVAYANRAAEAMLTTGNPVRAGPDGWSAATMASTRALQRLVHDATIGSRGVPRSGSVRLPSPLGRAPTLAMAMPIRPGAYDPFDLASPTALLCLIDRDQHGTPSPSHLVTLFGLTRSEAELASDLLSGSPLHDIAHRTGRSVNTVRTLLSRVMAKTETNRQSELVGLLARLPHETVPDVRPR